jgi:hypothetical protein
MAEMPELLVTRWPRWGQFVTVMYPMGTPMPDVMQGDGAVVVRNGDELRRGDVRRVMLNPVRDEQGEVIGWDRAVRVWLEGGGRQGVAVELEDDQGDGGA